MVSLTSCDVSVLMNTTIFQSWFYIINLSNFFFQHAIGLWRMEELAMLHWKHSASFQVSYHRISNNDIYVYSELYHMDRKGPGCNQKLFILDLGSTAATMRLMRMVKFPICQL